MISSNRTNKIIKKKMKRNKRKIIKKNRRRKNRKSNLVIEVEINNANKKDKIIIKKIKSSKTSNKTNSKNKSKLLINNKLPK